MPAEQPEGSTAPLSSRTFALAKETRTVVVVTTVASGLLFGCVAIFAPEQLAAVTTPWAGLVAAGFAAMAGVTAAHGARHWGKGQPSGRGEA